MRAGCRCQKREYYEEKVSKFVIHGCVTQFFALLKCQTLGHPAINRSVHFINVMCYPKEFEQGLIMSSVHLGHSVC